MPSKKKKYNSRFPPARIKKIMQSDEEVGKVAQVVPIIISKALEMFVQSLLRSSSEITRSRNARTLTPNHIKASILSCDEFHFLRDIAQTIPDVNPGADGDDEEGATSGSATPYPHNSTNRSTHPMSASGQAAATGFRMRGRPRKRPIEASTQSSRSLASTVDEPEDESEEEDEDNDDEDEDEEADREHS